MRLHSKSNLLLTLQKKKFRTDIPEGELLLAGNAANLLI